MSSHLQYGDFITIQSSYEEKETHKIEGSLSAKGFFDNKVYFQTHPPPPDPKSPPNTLAITNYRDFVFQVWPLISFEASKLLAKIQKEKALLRFKRANNQKSENEAKFEEKANELEADYQQCQEKLKAELDYNRKTFTMNFGYDVTYGTDLLLQHVDSGMYLSSRIVTSQADKSAFQFELSDKLSSGMVFRFNPKFKLRQYGESIQYSDQLLIFSVKLGCYINYATDKPIPVDQILADDKNAKPFKPYYRAIRTKRIDAASDRFEAFLSQTQDHHWHLGLHKREDHNIELRAKNEKKFIHGGELIRLRNKETAADLTATINFLSKDNAELYMRQYSGSFNMERETVNSLFEIELSEQTHNRGFDCVFQDEKASENPSFRLRHFMTGYLLGFQDMGGKKVPVLLNGSNAQKAEVFQMRFISTVSKDSSVLRNYGAYHLEFAGAGGLFLKPDESRTFRREDVLKLDQKEEIFEPLKDDEMFLKRTPLILDKGSSEENAFQILKPSDEEKTLLLRLASAVPFLTYLRDIFRHDMRDEGFEDVCRNALKMLSNLIFFMIKTEGTDPVECDGLPIQEHQKYFRDMKLIEILVDLLYFPFRNEMYNLNSLDKVPQFLIMIFRLSYRLIKFSIKEYRPNELYASQWLGLFMFQTLYADSEVDIMSEPTLTELIDNNKVVLQNKITKEHIKRFVEPIRQTPMEKFVKLLRAVCVCDEEPMIFNQLEISKLVFEKPELVVPLEPLFDNSKKINGILIRFKGDQIDLKTFWGLHKASPEMDYFVSTIELMADLCLDKNFLAIKPLREIYTFPICSWVISQEEYGEKIRAAFIRLVVTLWIEAESEELPTLSSIRTWDQIEQGSLKMICSDKSLEEFNGIRDFLKEYLSQVSSVGYMKAFEVEKNKLTLEVLELLKTMATCGFFKSKEEINGLLPSLLTLLNSANDVSNEEEDLQMGKRVEKKKKKHQHNSPRKKAKKAAKTGKATKHRFTTRYTENEETLILMQSKQVICDILKVFFDLGTDLRLTLFMQEFRQEFEALSHLSEAANNPNPEDSGNQTLSAILKSSKRLLKKIGLQETEELRKTNYDVFQYQENPINWVQKVVKAKLIDIVDSAPVDIMAMLLDLTLYKNQQLVNKAFELLYKLNSQHSSVFQAVREVMLLETPALVRAFQDIQKLKDDLKKMVDSSEIWFHEPLKHLNDFQAFEDTLNKLLDFLELQIEDPRSIKGVKEPEEEEIPREKVLNIEDDIEERKNTRSIPLDSEETSILTHRAVNKDRQELMRNIGLAECVIDMVKYELDVISEKDEDPRRMRLLKLIYRFLAGFCHVNPRNQAVLEVHFEMFIKHFKAKPRSDVHLLIIELFHDNKKLLFDSDKIEEIFEAWCSVLCKAKELPLKEYLMNALQIFLRFKDQSIKINQTKLISQMGSNENKGLLRIFGVEDKIEDFIAKVNHFQDTVKQKAKSNTVIEIPSEIGFFCQELLILSLASEEKNYAAESRCQVFFPLETIRKLLIGTKDMWYLRKYILFFLYNVYLETEKEVNESAIQLDLIIDQVLDEFECIVGCLDNELNVELKTFRGSTNLYQIQLDYLIVAVLPCLVLILKQQLMSSGKTLLCFERSLKALIKIAPQVNAEDKLKAPLIDLLNTIIKKKSIMNKIEFDENYKNQLSSLLNERRTTKLINYKKTYTHKLVSNAPDTISKSEKFHKRLDQTMKSAKYQDLVEQEFTALVNNIVDIEEGTMKTYGGFCTIGFPEISASLLGLIDPTDLVLSADLTIVGLKVFRKIIERENKDITTCAADWSVAQFAPHAKKIESRQNQLCDFGLVEVIGNMIGSDVVTSRELKDEAIRVAISMLVGGNSKVQDRFYRYLSSGTDDPDNKLLVNLKHMLEEDFQRVRKVMYQRNREYDSRLMDLQMEQAEARESTMIQKVPSKEAMTNSAKELKTGNEEEQRLIEKEEEDRKVAGLKKKAADEEDKGDVSKEEDEINEKIVNCTRIFRLLQLFCEGHREELQKHLRVQIMFKRIHGKTQNFISNCSYKFGAMVKFVNVHCTGMLNQLIDFLIEAIQGPCVLNQLELSKAKIVEFVKDLLSSFQSSNDYYKRGFMDLDEQETINSIVTKSSNLLISLVEGNTTDDILRDLCLRLDFRFMRSILAKEYIAFLTNKLGLTTPFPTADEVNEMIKFEKYEGNLGQAFNLFILIKTIANNIKSDDPESKNAAQYALEQDPEDTTPEANSAVEFFNSNVASIEILFQDHLHRVFFPIEPACRNLTMNTRDKLMQEVKRDSPNEKIMGLLSASAELYNEMEHMTQLRTWKVTFTGAWLSFFRDLSTFMALFLNILMMATFDRRIKTDPDQTDFSTVYTVVSEGWTKNRESGEKVDALLWAFGATQVATSGLMLVYWVVLYSKLVVKRKWRDLIKENLLKMWDSEKEAELEDMDSIDLENIDGRLGEYILYVKGPESKYFLKDGKRDFGSNFLKFNYYLKSTVFLLSEPGLLYAIFYIMVSLFGLLLSPLFYSYHLLDIVVRFETLKNVIRSVTRNANQLLLTLFLGLIILYMFTIIMFFFLFDAYWNQSIQPNGDPGELMCSTMFQCYLTTINMGLRNGGGFGDKTTDEPYYWNNRGRYYLSFLIKICSFALINIIFLNIIFGIIIDTFAELRDEKNRIDSDKKNICFICGLDRYNFEKTGEGFEAHIERDHHLWNYIYYIYYLRTKDETDYSGIESTIAANIEKDDISWFPMMKAMVLGEGEKKVMAGDVINEKTEVLKGKIEEIATVYDQKVRALKKKK